MLRGIPNASSGKPGGFQVLGRFDRRGAALDHVGEQRNTFAEAVGNAGKFLGRPRGLDEKRIGAGLDIALRAFDGGCEAFDGDGVGAGDDQRVFAGPCIRHCCDLSGHLGR